MIPVELCESGKSEKLVVHAMLCCHYNLNWYGKQSTKKIGLMWRRNKKQKQLTINESVAITRGNHARTLCIFRVLAPA